MTWAFIIDQLIYVILIVRTADLPFPPSFCEAGVSGNQYCLTFISSSASNSSTEIAMSVSEFDRLLTRNVPHILEKIFLSMDYKTFKECQEVSKEWNNLLMSESFLTRGKTIFCEEIQSELIDATKSGNIDIIIKLLSSFRIDVNFTSEKYNHADKYACKHMSPLGYASWKGHRDLVKLLLDREAQPNMANTAGATPLHYAALHGHKDVVQLLLNGGAEPNLTMDTWTHSTRLSCI